MKSKIDQYISTRIFIWGLVALFWMALGQQVNAQSQSKDDPNSTPYETERTVAEHVLAFPSYLMHWVSRPVGVGIKYVEERYPYWFEGERGPYGFFPLIEIGGEEGIAAGALLYHDHLFFKDHRARAELLFGSQIYNDFNLSYDIPIKGVSEGRISFEGSYENDPERAYYQNNNARDLSYASEFGSVELQYNQQISTNLYTNVKLGYQDRTIKTSTYEDDPDEQIAPSLLGRSKLFTIGNYWRLNDKNGQKRILNGTQYIAGGSWTQSTANRDLSFIEYHGEIHHFLPVPILPETRRLGLKMQLHKQVNLSSQDIPFYELASLGGTRGLRGFPSHRFQGKGTVLMTAEYRYPVWDFLDMVLFMDHGQPFDSYGDLAFDRFRSSYGFGFHLLSQQGLAFRSEFAFSNEGGRFIISITPNF